MADFGNFPHTSELCVVFVGSSVPLTPGVPAVPVLQAFLSPSTF